MCAINFDDLLVLPHGSTLPAAIRFISLRYKKDFSATFKLRYKKDFSATLKLRYEKDFSQFVWSICGTLSQQSADTVSAASLDSKRI